MSALEKFSIAIAIFGFAALAVPLLLLRFSGSSIDEWPRLRAIGLLAFTYSLAFWALVGLVYVPHTRGLAPTLSRHNTYVQISQDSAYSYFSIAVHVGFSLFLIVGGTYFAIKYWRQHATKP